MTTKQQHIIEKLNLEVNLSGSRQEAERLSRELSTGIKELLLPHLEKVFDELISEDRHFSLPELEVEMEWSGERPQVKDLLPVLEKGILEQLRKAGTHTAEIGMEAQGLEGRSAEKHLLETLRFILQKGRHPWWWQGEWDALENGLERIVEQQPELVREFLRRLGLNTTNIRQRLILQISPMLREQLLRCFWGQDLLQEMLGTLSRLQEVFLKVIPRFRNYQNTGIQDFLFRQISVSKAVREKATLWAAAVEFWTTQYELEFEYDHVLQRLNSLGKKGEMEAADLDMLRKKLIQLTEEKTQILALLVQLDLTDDERRRIEHWLRHGHPIPGYLKNEWLRQLEKVDKALADRIMERDTAKGQLPDPGFPTEGLYVENCGLVLLHPFLLLFFQKSGICRDEEFVNRESREKAVHVLQYLATGKTQVSEAEMVFNKVLCGLMPEDPIRRELPLSAELMQEADHLLQVVLNYWKALGGTSIDGLRANFLIREGKLGSAAQDWKLTVERKPQDILLKQLPWGVGVIKLPWMTSKMFVEW